MSHDIETYGEQAAFASAREVAWHRLGTVTDGAMTAAEAAEIAHLGNWNVRQVPLVTGLPSWGDSPDVHTDMEMALRDTGLTVPDRFANVRTNPFTGNTDVLGVVGKTYKIVQNEKAFEVLNAIAHQSGAVFETAGSLADGKRVFMSMKMPEGVTIGGADAHDLYLVATTTHDGTGAFTCAATPVRVVCQNTLTWGLQDAKQKWTLRHTSNINGRIAEARESLALTWKYRDAWSEQMNHLLDVEFTNAEFKAMTETLIPDSTATRGTGHQDNVLRNRRTLQSLFANADTQDYGRGTKYAAVNAVAEYADWFAPVKGVDPTGAKRAERAMVSGTVEAMKNRGLALIGA